MDAKIVFGILCDSIEEFTAHATFINAVLDADVTLGEVQVRFANMELLNKQIRESYGNLKRLELTVKDRTEVETRFRIYNQSCYATMGKFQELIRRRQASETSAVVPPQMVHRPKVKFPEIKLPEFKGELEKWTEFRDRFESLVNRNNELSKIDKFNYLLSAVQLPSDQQSVLQNFPLSEENYDEAWKAVCERYNDTRKLKSQHFNSLLNVNRMSSESPSELRRVLDSFASNFTALDLLGTTHDDFRVHIVQARLDDQTLKDWRKWIDEEEPTWPRMKEFLTRQWRTLDSIPQKSGIQMHQADTTEDSSTPTTTASCATLSCHWCQEPHLLYSCSKFLAASMQERRNFVDRKKLCNICFSPSHSHVQCRYATTRQCRVCKGAHNQLEVTSQTSSNSRRFSSRIPSTIKIPQLPGAMERT